MNNNNNSVTRKLSFGKFYMYEGIIPCIEINMLNEDGTTVDRTVGYLSAFRDYCFQVSGTWCGENDKGSTPVFGLDTFGHILQAGRSNCSQQETVKYFIASIAFMAVVELANKGGYIYPDDPEDEIISVNYRLPSDYNVIYWGANEEYKKFVDACYNRYVLGASKIKNAPYYDLESRKVVDPNTTEKV
jgi:hypothetical protein